jgi:hypothetical protein
LKKDEGVLFFTIFYSIKGGINMFCTINTPMGTRNYDVEDRDEYLSSVIDKLSIKDLVDSKSDWENSWDD